MQTVENVAINEIEVSETEGTHLLDCYRIALDFGMPAAMKAYEKLILEPGVSTDLTIGVKK